MSEITFTKMHGLGNCYVYINAFAHKLQESQLSDLAKKLSCVNTGIGSDGMILIGPSKKADVKMRIFNKDGSEAKNCGNGLRCVAKYAYENKLVFTKTMTIETLGGVVEATITSQKGIDTYVTVNMGKPRLSRKEVPMLGADVEKIVAEPFVIDGKHLAVTAVSMGNPHAVFFVSDIKKSLHIELGKKIEKDPRFPEGVNVEFVSVSSPTSIQCRVWERGSGVTAACGTGACAVAVAAVLNGHSQKGKNITIHLEGGDLNIQWTEKGDILMDGPATYIAQGVFKCM